MTAVPEHSEPAVDQDLGPGQPLVLAGEFVPATRAQWEVAVAAVLTKAGRRVADPPDATLATETYDELTIAPLYTAADVPAASDQPIRAPRAGESAQAPEGPAWDVRQRYAEADPAAVNAAILGDLAAGVTSLWLVLGVGGTPLDALGGALDGVYLDLAPIALDAGADTLAAADALLALTAERGVAAGVLAGSLGADPIGFAAHTGETPAAGLVVEAARRSAGSPLLRAATVDAVRYAAAGASDADELAIATAVGVAYLRELTAAGLELPAALGELEFRLALGADQFAGIAKLRAARRLWARVAELSGAAPEQRGQYLHAVSAPAMLTRRDPWVNLLRGTISTFAAAVGGADAITTAPFDAAIGRSDDLARRLARNTQAILHDESSLARVADPAGGSWYVEARTAALARRAWARFTEIERAGGALAALRGGLIPGWITDTARRRAADVAHRRAPITGVSEFALLTEEPLQRPPMPAERDTGPLPPRRDAAPFEALRDRADAYTARHAQRPRVTLAALGPRAAHSARVAFAANLLQAGGIEPITVAGAAEFSAADTPVACLCGSDDGYAESGAGELATLRGAGAAQVWLAGKPAALPGADGYLFAGCDALAVLETIFDTLEALR